jgi:hypothetical protein
MELGSLHHQWRRIYHELTNDPTIQPMPLVCIDCCPAIVVPLSLGEVDIDRMSRILSKN